VRFRASLAKLHHQHIAALHGHLNNSYTKAWLDSATDFLATEPAGTEAAAGTS